jgi:hypothetical protein
VQGVQPVLGKRDRDISLPTPQNGMVRQLLKVGRTCFRQLMPKTRGARRDRKRTADKSGATRAFTTFARSGILGPVAQAIVPLVVGNGQPPAIEAAPLVEQNQFSALDDEVPVLPEIPDSFEITKRPSFVSRMFGGSTAKYDSRANYNMRLDRLLAKKGKPVTHEEAVVPLCNQELYAYCRTAYKLSGYPSQDVKEAHMDAVVKQYYREFKIERKDRSTHDIALDEKTYQMVCNISDMEYTTMRRPYRIDTHGGVMKAIRSLFRPSVRVPGQGMPQAGGLLTPSYAAGRTRVEVKRKE